MDKWMNNIFFVNTHFAVSFCESPYQAINPILNPVPEC